MSVDEGYSEAEKAKRRIALECYKTGTQALAKSNFDYAVKMYSKSVELVPDNLLYRQVLRGAERQMYKNNGKGASMASMRMIGIRAKTKKAKLQKSWRDLDQAAEEGLIINPWDVGFNAEIGEAASQLGYDEVAVFGYEKAAEMDPNNKDLLGSLALAYERRSRFTDAVTCWERVLQMEPLHVFARSKITQLNAQATIHQGDFDRPHKPVEPMVGYEESVTGGANGQGAAAPGESIENDLRHAIRKNPTGISNYLRLAEYYRREGKLDDSLQTLQKALEVSGGDPNVREKLEDTQLEQLRRNRDLAKQMAASNPQDTGVQQQYGALVKEVLQQEITVLSRRVERYPQDMKMKYELAQMFYQIGKYAQAIPLLQKAAKDPRLEAQVNVSLGKCFLKEHRNELAEFQFKQAVTKLNPQEQEKALVECTYLLGRLAEASGRRDDAIQRYNEVISIEYDYKDARNRLETLQGGLGGGSGVKLGDI